MTDPQLPVERGLRATVRLAAGINTGDVEDHGDAAGGVRRVFADGIAALGLRARLERLASGLSDLPLRAVMRSAGLGAAGGAAIVAVAFAGLVGEAVLTAPAAPEIALRLEEAAAKADRSPIEVKLASLGGTALADPTSDGNLAVTTVDGEAITTVALPVQAFAPSDVPAAGSGLAAIDRVLDTAPIGPASTTIEPPPVTLASLPVAGEEEDDDRVEPLLLPMPRPRPQVDLAPLPLPKPRPRLLASLGPVGMAGDIGEPGAPEAPVSRAPEPAQRPSSNALGFFASPTDPVRAPSKTIDTPFGVPYVLQTGSVETACLKPELVEILRKIEGRYHQKVIITSGFRDRGRQGSLHRQCAAVDIEVPGVDAASLASFARTIPAIGGVGTYCHPHMIHVDIGQPRDWKYGCGSYFAMRGTPGKWGKVPGTLAKAQTTGAPNVVASDAQEEE